MITEEFICRVKASLQRQKLYIALGCIESLEKENKELEEENKQLANEHNSLVIEHERLDYLYGQQIDEINNLFKENERLKQQIEKLQEGKQYETCPYRSTDMG